jgi:hypothetical protein
MADFKWDNKRSLAAQLLAEGKLTDDQIAETVGVSAQTIRNWQAAPEFAGRVEDLVSEFARKARRRGLAILERRVAALNDRWFRLQQIIEERAADPALAGVPGGSTGLIVRQVKAVKVWEAEAADTDLSDCVPTKQSQLVEEFAVDTGLLNELRQHEKQAAQELGQWTEKREIGGDPDKPFVVKQLKNVSMDEL